jgi:lysophospholipase L1-like esterase
VKRPAFAITLVAAAVGAAALLALVLTRDAAAPASAGSVTLVGDSLNVGIEPYLVEALDGWRISNNNVEGRSGKAGLAELARLGRTLAPVVVISLGTNDPQDDVGAFRTLVDEVMRRVGRARCVVWSTVWLHGPNRAFNDALEDAAARYPRLEIADWVDLVTEDRRLLAFDGVHGTPEGYARRADQIARIVRACNPRSA